MRAMYLQTALEQGGQRTTHLLCQLLQPILDLSIDQTHTRVKLTSEIYARCMDTPHVLDTYAVDTDLN